MENTTGRLTDYFDIKDIQSLQNALARVVQLPIVIVDAGGQPLTKPCNAGFFCTLETAGQACRGCWTYLPHPRLGDPSFGCCPRTGLSLVGVPISLGDACLGGWVLGQLRLTKPSGKTLKNVAHTNTIRLQDAKTGMDAIPRVGWEELSRVLRFLACLQRLLPQMILPGGACSLPRLTAMIREEDICPPNAHSE